MIATMRRTRKNPLLGELEHADPPRGPYQLAPVLDVAWATPEETHYVVTARLYNGDYVNVFTDPKDFGVNEDRILIKREGEGDWSHVTYKDIEKILEPLMEEQANRSAANAYTETTGGEKTKYKGVPIEEYYMVASFGDVTMVDGYETDKWKERIPKTAIKIQDNSYVEWEEEFEISYLATELATMFGLGRHGDDSAAAQYIEEKLKENNHNSNYMHAYTTGWQEIYGVLGQPVRDYGYWIAESVKGSYYPVTYKGEFFGAFESLDDALLAVYEDQDWRNRKDQTAFIASEDGSIERLELYSRRAGKVLTKRISAWDKYGELIEIEDE